MHIDASISLSTLSGTWRDNRFLDGTFAFGASSPGSPRSQAMNVSAFAVNNPAYLLGLSARGSRDTPLPPQASQPLAVIGGAAFAATVTGGLSPRHTGFMAVTATEDWTVNGWGTRLDLSTTPNGSPDPVRRLTITHNGFAGIGTTNPQDQLQVDGDIRIGTQLFGGCLRSFAGSPIIGTCSSDARFKRDITSFASVLDRVAALHPVHYYWRAAEFPTKAFGSDQTYGLIAQDVAAVLPEIVSTDADGYHVVDYAKLPLLAIQAIKELKEKNDRLEQRLDALERLTRD